MKNMDIYKDLIDKKTSLSVVGLGYVGLPIALAFAKKLKVIGFDINAERIALLRNNIDPSAELSAADFEGADISFTASPDDLQAASFHIVAVPTPIDEQAMPDLRPLRSASEIVGRALKKGDYVVYESTVYPGCTEEECIPILERMSGLRFKQDFMVGYSPERINPGDKEHTLAKIVKVVSGCCDHSLENIAKVYELVVDAGVHRTSSIKTAEAAKIIENTQRDPNIALMNELSMICDKLDISTAEVLEAAGTKWNFLKFTPGLVGGHCIGVDPYYLTYKARALGHNPQVILSGRSINDRMGMHIAEKTVRLMIKAGKNISLSKALVMGITFKENVKDIRNSKVADVVKELQAFGVQVSVTDPYASSEELMEEYGFGLSEIDKNYDAVILAVPHREYLNLDDGFFREITNEGAVVVDVKGVVRGKVKELNYWGL